MALTTNGLDVIPANLFHHQRILNNDYKSETAVAPCSERKQKSAERKRPNGAEMVKGRDENLEMDRFDD